LTKTATYFRYKDLIPIKYFASLKRKELSHSIIAYTNGTGSLRKLTGHRKP